MVMDGKLMCLMPLNRCADAVFIDEMCASRKTHTRHHLAEYTALSLLFWKSRYRSRCVDADVHDGLRHACLG